MQDFLFLIQEDKGYEPGCCTGGIHDTSVQVACCVALLSSAVILFGKRGDTSIKITCNGAIVIDYNANVSEQHTSLKHVRPLNFLNFFRRRYTYKNMLQQKLNIFTEACIKMIITGINYINFANKDFLNLCTR